MEKPRDDLRRPCPNSDDPALTQASPCIKTQLTTHVQTVVISTPKHGDGSNGEAHFGTPLIMFNHTTFLTSLPHIKFPLLTLHEMASTEASRAKLRFKKMPLGVSRAL